MKLTMLFAKHLRFQHVTPGMAGSPNVTIRRDSSTLHYAQHLLDVCAIVVSLYGLTWLLEGDVHVRYIMLAGFAALMSTVIYHTLGVYRTHSVFRSGTRLVLAWATVIGFLLLLGAATKTTDSYSRLVFFGWALTALGCQLCLFVGFALIRNSRPVFQSRATRALVVGQGEHARHLHRMLNQSRQMGVSSLGIVSDREHVDDAMDSDLLCGLGGIRTLCVSAEIDRVYVAVPMASNHLVERISRDLLPSHIELFWIPDLGRLHRWNSSVGVVAGMPMIAVSEHPDSASRKEYIAKALLDRVGALIALVLFSPVLILSALAVKLTSSGPVIFTQKRHGLNGQVIHIYKFRSMWQSGTDSAHKPIQAVENDPRLTPVGRWLRSTSIDELPQLFNVLKGDMSLVGPRPHALGHNHHYRRLIDQYEDRHLLKPGITGLAQINGWRGATDTDEKMQNRVDFDIHYIRNWSLALDISILIKTPMSLLVHKAH